MNLIQLLTAACITIGAWSAENCTSEKCSAPMKLNSPSFSLDSTWKISAEVKINKIRRNKPMAMVRVARKSVYCSEIPLDEYDTCHEVESAIDMSGIEAAETDSRGTCKVGNECIEEGDCWGSGAQECYSRERKNFVSPQRLPKMQRWFKFPYHTCSQSWECTITRFNPRIQLKPRGVATIITPMGEEVTFRLEDTTAQTPMNYTIVFNLWNQTLSKITKAQCISHMNKSICVVEDDTSYLAEFDSEGKFYSNDKVVTLINHLELAMHPLVKFNDLLDDAPITIAQAKEMQSQILYDNLQAHLNTKILEKGIENLYQIVFRSLVFLGKKNPSLMNRVLGLPGFTTDSNGDTFIQCPCIASLSEDTCDHYQIRDSETEKCLGSSSKPLTYVNYTWASGLDWTSVPELEFYTSSTYQQLLEDMRSQHIMDSHAKEERERENQMLMLDYSEFMSSFFKKYSWLAAWISLFLSAWLAHVWCAGAIRSFRS